MPYPPWLQDAAQIQGSKVDQDPYLSGDFNHVPTPKDAPTPVPTNLGVKAGAGSYPHTNTYFQTPDSTPTVPENLDKHTTITINDEKFDIEADDLEVICELGKRNSYISIASLIHR